MPDSPWSLAPGVILGAFTTLNALNYLGYVAAAIFFDWTVCRTSEPSNRFLRCLAR